MPPKLNKNQLQDLLESSQRDKQALERPLLDMEALVKSLQSGTRFQSSIPSNSLPNPPSTSPIQGNPLMSATAKMIQDSSNVKKT